MPHATIPEVELRVERVINLILNGAQRAEIVQFCADEWNVKDRQADNYISKASEYIKTITKDNQEVWIAKAKYRLEDLYKTARMKQDLKTCLSIIDTANRVLGYEKLNIDHNGSISLLSKPELEKLAKEFIEECKKDGE